MRELRVYGTEKFTVRLTYEEGGSPGRRGTEVEETLKSDYYEAAEATMDGPDARWEANDLGWNAHVIMTKTIVMNEVLSYFG